MRSSIILRLAVFLVALGSQSLANQHAALNLDYCPPSYTVTKQLTEPENAFSVTLGIEPESGCHCKEYPKLLVVCFGRIPCQSFPRRLNITLKQLWVKTTAIKALKRGDLVKFAHLEGLTVDGNFNLNEIEDGVFKNMSNLITLSLSYNEKLRRLGPKTFEGLVNLKELSLINNGFSSVKDASIALSRVILPQLLKLHLNDNQFLRIAEDDFAPMVNSSLKQLYLFSCQIEEIHPKAFLWLHDLEALRLGQNSFNDTSVITKLIEEIAPKLNLKSLNLFESGLSKTPPHDLMVAIAKSNITHLVLARNRFETITSQSFLPMPKIKKLDLDGVNALNITDDAFATLPNLKTLILRGNKLSSIPDGVLLEQLMCLDLQSNSGNKFKASYFSLFGRGFVKMKMLRSLNLSFNAIYAIYNTTFDGLGNLEWLGLKNATIFGIYPNAFRALKNLVFLDLRNNPFTKKMQNTIEKDFFSGLDNLQYLFLSGCDIKFINKSENPFAILQKLKHLGLEHNNLKTIDSVSVLSNLVTLDLSDNNLQPWQQPILTYNVKLRQLYLNNNKFQILTSQMYLDFKNLSKIELAGNPFICDCHFDFPDNKTLSLIINQSIFCTFPDFTTNITLGEFLLSQRQVCQLQFLTRLSIILPASFFIVLLTITAILFYFYRWHLRYWLFLTRLYLSRKGKIKPSRKETHCNNYTYDAFVSYSNEDRNFVIRLVSMLETYPPYLKLCVYERDFQIGTIISESVLESVARSRRTLLIISDSYAKSQWCRWESQIAEHHRLFFQNQDGEYVDDSLVLIKLGPVSEAHLTPTLKFLLKTRIYLMWDQDEKKQKMFWEKLRAALAPPPPEILENTHL